MSRPALVGIYRHENAALVERLVAPAVAAGWSTGWWALDRVPAALRETTVGEGPGEKLPLLNETVARLGRRSGPVVLADDDISFRKGNVVALVSLAARSGLGIAQPAHVTGSEVSHGITRVRPRSRVRLTTFVESGPLVAVSEEWVDRILPLPAERGMGWGVELDWADLMGDGCRLGIVDGVTILHQAKVGRGYDDSAMRARLRIELADRGVDDWAPLQRTLAVWRPWQRRPPWHT